MENKESWLQRNSAVVFMIIVAFYVILYIFSDFLKAN